MYSVFTKNGFTNVTSSINLKTGAGLKVGDVLLNKDHHTEMVSAVNGSTITLVAAHSNENGGVTGGKSGDQNGKEISVKVGYYNYPWNYVLRYTG